MNNVIPQTIELKDSEGRFIIFTKQQFNNFLKDWTPEYEEYFHLKKINSELLEALKKIANHTSEADASISMREIAQEAIEKAEKQ